MTPAELAAAFDEWKRRADLDPGLPRAELRAAASAVAEANGGRAPTRGEICAEYLLALAAELRGPATRKRRRNRHKDRRRAH